jgi:hypothetical protein
MLNLPKEGIMELQGNENAVCSSREALCMKRRRRVNFAVTLSAGDHCVIHGQFGTDKNASALTINFLVS